MAPGRPLRVAFLGYRDHCDSDRFSIVRMSMMMTMTIMTTMMTLLLLLLMMMIMTPHVEVTEPRLACSAGAVHAVNGRGILQEPGARDVRRSDPFWCGPKARDMMQVPCSGRFRAGRGPPKGDNILYRPLSRQRRVQYDNSSTPCQVNGIAASGGGDAPEDIAGAFDKIAEMEWKSRTKLIIHIADAPCHGSQYHGLGDSYPAGDPHGLVPEKVWATTAHHMRVGMSDGRS
jgi:hypothetical protein